MTGEKTTDVLIVGAGPVGATYARKLVDAGINVLMVGLEAKKLKSQGAPQKPSAFGMAREIKYSDALAIDSLGGTSERWTCCTPEPHKEIERPNWFSDKEWYDLFNEARELIHTPVDKDGAGTQFTDSFRQQLVQRTLQKAYGEKRVFKEMPLACQRREDNKDLVDWSDSATVLGNITSGNNKFEALTETLCKKLLRDQATGDIKGAVIYNLSNGTQTIVRAKRYVICAGALSTPQILVASGFVNHLPALGKYMTIQTGVFCRVVFRKELLDEIKTDPKWKDIAEQHHKKFPNDPLWIPLNDYDPQVTTPVSQTYPWHAQIHRDALSNDSTPEGVDKRFIVDLRFFGYVEPRKENRVEFSIPTFKANGDTLDFGIVDVYGMPQSTLKSTSSKDDEARTSRMMADMTEVATKLGSYLPDAYPQYILPGPALHICGTTRAGTSVEDSCVDRTSRVYGSQNLFLGGSSVINTPIAGDPILTAMCFAIVGANTIVKELQGKP